MLSLIFIVCVEKELNPHLMTPNYNATHFNIFHHTGVWPQKALEPNDRRLWRKRWRSHVVRALASHQCGQGSNPDVDAICGWSLLLVLFFAPSGFSPGTPVFPSLQKPTFPNSNSARNQVDEEPFCGCATSKSLFYLFIIFLWYENRTCTK